MAGLLRVLALVVAVMASAPARAEVGVSLGPRAGVQLEGETDPFVGADLRLGFALSPLVLNPSFDYHFDEGRTLFQVAINALYPVPVAGPIKPYVGAGMGLTFFAYDEAARMSAGMPGTMPGMSTTPSNGYDAEGSRVALNLIAGASFPTRWLTPFVQGMVSYGKVDLVTIGGGVLFDLVGGR